MLGVLILPTATVAVGAIFMANAIGLVPPGQALADLGGRGLPAPLARAAVSGGRVLQAVAVVALFVPPARPWAAFALIGFLCSATWAAHGFWRYQGSMRERQFAQFLKNLAMAGGLLALATLPA